jgi:hypothetical protein
MSRGGRTLGVEVEGVAATAAGSRRGFNQPEA